MAVLTQRAKAAGIEAITLSPRLGDFNEDLHIFGLDALRAALRIQLVPEDVDRFLLVVDCASHRPSVCFDRSSISSVAASANAGRGRDHGLLEGDRTASGPGRQWLRRGYFPPRAGDEKTHYWLNRRRALHREAK